MVLKRVRMIVAVLALTFTGAAMVQAQPPQQPSRPTQQALQAPYVRNWADAIGEIRGDDAMITAAAILAETKGSTRAVRDYAKELVRSRDSFEGKLRKAAKKDRVMLPVPKAPEDAEQVRTSLEHAQSALAFDRAFLDAMIEANRHELLHIKQAEAEIEYSEVRQLLQALRLQVRTQFEEAKQLRTGMKPPGEQPPRTPRQEQSAPMQEH